MKKFKSFGFFSQNSSKFFKICSKNSVRILEEVRIVGVECCSYLILPNVKKNIVEMKLHITLISTHCDPTTTLCLCVYQSNVRLSCPWLWDIYYWYYRTKNLRNISWKWNCTLLQLQPTSTHCTEVSFSSFLSGGSNESTRNKLAKRISEQQHLVCVYIRPMSG